jgi:uncharacterized protein (DUF1800 family)
MQLIERSLAAFLCVSLAAPSNVCWSQAFASTAKPATGNSKTRPAYQTGQMHGDERILHALNRFTFGPRPGDVGVLRSIGLDNWFEQQLHPESLDLTDLNGRLSEFPAMQWNPEDLLYRLPSNAIIRQAIDGKAPVPDSGPLRAIYENQIYRVSAKKQEQAQKKQAELDKAAANPVAEPPSTSGGTMTDGRATPAQNSAPLSQAAPTAQSTGISSAQMSAAAPQAAAATPPIDPLYIDSTLALPPQQRIAELAAMHPPDIDNFFKALRPVQRNALEAGLKPEEREVAAALENPERLVVEELIAQRLTRDMYSTAQLQEVMTDFWMNHFNVYLRKNEATPYYLIGYERDVIRPLALGKFEDLLEATAHSPAMLLYLDNAESIGPRSQAAEHAQIAAARKPGNQKKAPQGLNENYARELMELHTVGVNGGYTQADVTEVARILTGWTVERPQRGGGFEFNPNRHEPGTKKALGQKFKDEGEAEGRELLHYLATRPATAQFISRKLAVRFVSDDPPQSLIDRLANTYLSSGGDISAMLRTLYHSPEFWSTSAYRAKVKTPLEFVVSAVRASDAQVDNLRPIANALRTLGMPLYGCVPPTGYNWEASTWVGTGALVDRMNFALNLSANRLQGITTFWSPQSDTSAGTLLATDAPSAEAEESRLESSIVSGGVSDSTRSAVMQQYQQQVAQNQQIASTQPIAAPPHAPQRSQGGTSLEKQDQLLAGLLIGSPEFQRR